MYLPVHFAATDGDAIRRLIDEHPFATLAHAGADGADADHLPLEFDRAAGPHGTLRGHVARANPLWQRADGRHVLAIFHGPHGYVSPGWYATKAETHRVVPTWNYAVVHARGVLRAVHDAAWLYALLSRLTARHEAGRPTPWALTDAPADHVDALLRAIVGVEIELTAVAAKFKLSQNRSAADRSGVVSALAAGTPADQALARQMQPAPPRR